MASGGGAGVDFERYTWQRAEVRMSESQRDFEIHVSGDEYLIMKENYLSR